jgi:hypothetical protein
MEVVFALAFVAYAGERLSEKAIKPFIKGISPYFPGLNQDLKDWVESIVCAIPGFALSVFFGLDLPAAVGLSAASTMVGTVFTGLCAGFGTNLVHDLLGYLDKLRGAG